MLLFDVKHFVTNMYLCLLNTSEDVAASMVNHQLTMIRRGRLGGPQKEHGGTVQSYKLQSVSCQFINPAQAQIT